MKYLKILFFFLVSGVVYGQQLSNNIPITDMRSDAGIQILNIQDDGYLILVACYCDEISPLNRCLGLMRIDETGNKIWSQTYEGSPDSNLNPNGRTMAVLNDTIYVANEVIKSGQKEIRIMSFDMNGEVLQQKDIAMPYEDGMYLQGMTLAGNKLVFYGTVYNGEKRIFLYSMDSQFNILENHLIGDPNFGKGDVELLRAEGGEGYLLTYSETVNWFISGAVVARLNDSFEVTFSKKILIGDGVFPSINIFETPDKGYMMAWHKDLSSSFAWDTFPYPSTVYKLDSLANVEWEYVFAHQSSKEHISAIKTQDGNMFGIGASDYFEVHDTYDRWLDGFCFLIDQEGNLLFDRTIADIRDSRGGRFWHGLQTDNGYAIVGDLDMINPTGVPFLNDPNVWFLTLDENGCWNGNCDNIIVINGDTSTSTKYTTNINEMEMEIYPNPNNGIFTIEASGNISGRERIVEITDLSGKLISRQKLFAPKSIINLSHMNSGIYFVTESVDGEKRKSEKIIITSY